MDTPQVCTITIIPTMNVRRALIGGRELAMREGTSDVNALDRVRPYVRGSSYVGFYAGSSREDVTLVVVVVRGYGKDVWQRAEARAKKLGKKYGGELPPYTPDGSQAAS